ncbi:MAG TPA: dienelactone hydrolase family protein [Kofleriaceae bacterium]|nr:dienelactone hydrolase family protein [Kofleriaceae bacterium]
MSPSSIGSSDEAAFKAEHQLKEAPSPGKGQWIDLGGTRAYLALPEGAKAPLPAIVVIHEWWGLNRNIELWSDRIAAEGWAALAVDLYGGKVAKTSDEAMADMKTVDDAAAAKVIDRAYDFLANDPRVHARKRAVIGWCFGGGWSLQTALAHPDLDGAIIYYGMLDPDPAHLAAIHGRVLGIFGNKDGHITPGDVDAFERGLASAHVKAEIHRYDAPHAFANPSNPAYDETSAADAWEHVKAFLHALSST